MSLKERIIKAKQHGGFADNVALAAAISRLAKREIPPQSIQKLTGPTANPRSSSLLPYIADACHVNLDWLAREVGVMAGASEGSQAYGSRNLNRFRDAVAGLFVALDELEPGSPERKIVEAEIAKHQKRRAGGSPTKPRKR